MMVEHLNLTGGYLFLLDICNVKRSSNNFSYSISNIYNYSTVTLIRCMDHFSYVFLSCLIKASRRSAVKTKCNEQFLFYCLSLLRILFLIFIHFFISKKYKHSKGGNKTILSKIKYSPPLKMYDKTYNRRGKMGHRNYPVSLC